MADLPEHYFRLRDGGCTVFRTDPDNRSGRLEMEAIAQVHLDRDEIKPVGDRVLDTEDKSAIRIWLRERRAIEKMREVDNVHRTLDEMQKTAHWVQSQADDIQLEEVTEQLLLTMHDLRSALVRRKAERLAKDG